MAELLFAPPAVELLFPGDRYANIRETLGIEQPAATVVRSETFKRALFVPQDAQIQIAGDALSQPPGRVDLKD